MALSICTGALCAGPIFVCVTVGVPGGGWAGRMNDGGAMGARFLRGVLFLFKGGRRSNWFTA